MVDIFFNYMQYGGEELLQLVGGRERKIVGKGEIRNCVLAELDSSILLLVV